MASVTLSNLTKTFPDGTVAVQSLDLTVDDGQLVVLVGPSGSGKSTTLRMIAGLETPTAGDIQIGDCLVNSLPPAKRNVAMVFQDYALYPHMSARQNMAFGLKTGDAIDEVATLLGIHRLLDRKPHELSGGEQQRVALGRAIVRRPALFLLDEPLANLDLGLRSSMRAELRALQRRIGGTMIHVTHDQTEAMTLGDQLVVLDRGVVQQAGPPLALYQQPANRFVATFLGSPPMNMIHGTIDAGMFRAEGLRWPVNTAHNGPAVLGIRPEHLVPAVDGQPTLAELPPQHIEHLGHELLIHFRLGEAKLIARVPLAPPVPSVVGNLLSTGQASGTLPVVLTIGGDQYHLFAADEQGRVI